MTEFNVGDKVIITSFNGCIALKPIQDEFGFLIISEKYYCNHSCPGTFGTQCNKTIYRFVGVDGRWHQMVNVMVKSLIQNNISKPKPFKITKK